MAEYHNDPQPPAAPEIHRRFRLTRWQWFGVPLFLLIPLLASFGLLGDMSSTVEARSGGLEITLEYPRTQRYKFVRSMEMVVTNKTAAILDTVTIELDARYADGFATSISIPSFDRAWAIDLLDLGANGSPTVPGQAI
jgi:hypothetical protein